jgi:hypothetical protein
MASVSALRDRAGTLGSARLRGAAEELLASALGKLEGRLRGPAGPARSLERMREVLERDRALAFAEHTPCASPPVTAPSESSPKVESLSTTVHDSQLPRRATAAQTPRATPCDEPIRTRTFARLLAAQGHAERALSIYAYLLDREPEDATLREEEAALRATLERELESA